MLAPKHPNRSLQQRDPLLVMHPGVIFCFPLQEFLRGRQFFLSFLEKYLPTPVSPDFWPFYSHMRIFWPFFARFWVSSLAQYKKAFGQFGPPKFVMGSRRMQRAMANLCMPAKVFVVPVIGCFGASHHLLWILFPSMPSPMQPV